MIPTTAAIADIVWESPERWPLAAAAGIVLAVAVVWLYPGQLRRVAAPWRWMLPGLRLLAMLALAVSLLKPVIVRPAAAEEQGALLVLLDRSRSMSITDNSRQPAELVAIADALGRLPPGSRRAGATALAEDVERMQSMEADVRAAQDDLDYARVSGRDVAARQARLERAVSQFSSEADAAAGRAAGPLRQRLLRLAHTPPPDAREAWRRQVHPQIVQAAAAVVQFRRSADDALYAADPQVREACVQVGKRSRFELAMEAIVRPTSGLLARTPARIPVVCSGVADGVTPLEIRGNMPLIGAVPDGVLSNLTAGVATAAAGRPVRAVVLLSDGRQVGGDPTLVAGLTPSGVPLFTVDVSAPAAPHDISFGRDVSVPASAYAGEVVRVRAPIRQSGFARTDVEVQLQFADEPARVQRVTLSEKGGVAEFPLELKAPGAHRLRLSITSAPGEATDDNNRIERWIKVLPDRMKVALYAGASGGELDYLQNAILHTPWVELKDGTPDAGGRLAVDPQQLVEQDVVILMDLPESAFDASQWDAIDTLVRDRGGSVILVAGRGRLPAGYGRSQRAAGLLPFDPARIRPTWQVWPEEQPAFHFVPDPRAESLEMFSPNGNPDDNQKLWQELPGFDRFLELPDEKGLRPGTRVLLREDESRAPAMTENRLGAGRAFFLCLNQLSQWDRKFGPREQDGLWLRLVHYASEDPYFAAAGPLSLDLDKVAARPMEAVRVRTRVLGLPAPRAGTCELHIVSNGAVVETKQLAAAGASGSGRYEGSIRLPAGDYQLRLEGAAGQALQVPLQVAASDEAEMADLAGDEAMLRKLAQASGGEFFRLEDIARLPERLEAAGDDRPRMAELPLWDSPYLLLFVFACFAAEWALRKRCGLT